MSRRNFHLPWHEYVQTLEPHERPMMPGSPATPSHSPTYRLAYLAVGILVIATGSIGSAMVTANTQQLAGALGVTTTEAAWLPVVYVMTNACMNLLLIKFRQQYGLRLFAEIFLTAYVVISLGALYFDDYGSSLVVRAAAGMAAAAMSSLGFLYTLQAFPPAHRLKGLIFAIGAAGFALPATRLFSNHLVELSEWRGFHAFELGLSLLSLAAVFTLRLPPSERLKVFNKGDFLTFALFAPGVALLCVVLSQGRFVWWFNAPWLGWCLAAAIVLLSTSILVELHREQPLLHVRWLTSADMLRLAVIILLFRIVLSEQGVGALGFLQAMGVNNDQMRGLSWVMFWATLAGVIGVAVTINPARVSTPALIALLLITAAAWADSRLTSLTRPEQMYLSQGLIAFASALFLPAAMLAGFARAMRQGQEFIVSFAVIFGAGQSLGALIGSAFLGTLLTIRQRAHTSQIVEHLTLVDPQVVARLRQYSGVYAGNVVDPALRQAEGVALLGQVVAREATALAYGDVFRVIAALSLLVFFYLLAVRLREDARARRAASALTPAEAA